MAGSMKYVIRHCKTINWWNRSHLNSRHLFFHALSVSDLKFGMSGRIIAGLQRRLWNNLFDFKAYHCENLFASPFQNDFNSFIYDRFKNLGLTDLPGALRQISKYRSFSSRTPYFRLIFVEIQRVGEGQYTPKNEHLLTPLSVGQAHCFAFPGHRPEK